ncbi:unnamed protein product [Symbiodinium sp. CCMP2456]|nr:unnamed protein product [Symbiodinium sp. CCMP2456]
MVLPFSFPAWVRELTQPDDWSQLLVVFGMAITVFGYGILHLVYAYIDRRVTQLQKTVAESIAAYMQDGEQKQEALREHADGLLDKCMQTILSPKAVESLLEQQNKELSVIAQIHASATFDHLMGILPAFVGKSHDEHSMLFRFRRLYLALQPTKLLTQQAHTAQSSLDELQGSSQQWFEGEVVQKMDAVIDILTKVQVELTTLGDSMGPDFSYKVIGLWNNAWRSRNSKKTEACSLSNNNLNQETLRDHDEKLKRQSDALSKMQWIVCDFAAGTIERHGADASLILDYHTDGPATALNDASVLWATIGNWGSADSENK